MLVWCLTSDGLVGMVDGLVMFGDDDVMVDGVEDVHDLHSHGDDVVVNGVDDVVVDDVKVADVMQQQIPAVGCATTAL